MPPPLAPAPSPGPRRSNLALRIGASLLALALLAFDTFTPVEGAVAVLYVVVILIAARTGRRRDIIAAAAVGIGFTITAYLAAHGVDHYGSALLRCAVSLAAIGITALLVLHNQSTHASLLRSERRYRRMFDASRVGVVEEDWSAIRAALDERGLRDPRSLALYISRHPDFVGECLRRAVIVGGNAAFYAMVGPSEDGPRSVDDLLADTDRTFAKALIAYVAGERSYDEETELRRGDGSLLPVNFSITYPCAEDGDPEGNVLVFVIDIAERRQAHDALMTAQADLAHAVRVATLGEFTASIAHEVNQPLMAVVTSGEAAQRWLRRDPPVLVEVEASLGRIVAEGRRASEIVARTRAFLSKAAPVRDRIEVATLVEEAILVVERELVRARVTLRIDVAPDLPPIRGDRIQLQQILVNLMVNAGQAMAGATGQRLLTVRGRGIGEGIEITVHDTGPGIAEADLARLFTRFFTTRTTGMGLGLAISRTTAEAHGGGLTVESTPGAGATFRLKLPLDGGEA